MFSMTGCVLIWNAAFNWLGVCYIYIYIPATLFELFVQFSRCAFGKKEKIRSLIWIVVIRSIWLGGYLGAATMKVKGDAI